MPSIRAARHKSADAPVVAPGDAVRRPHPPWHCVEAGEVEQRLAVDAASGLDTARVRRRRARYGDNELQAQRRRPAWRVFARQLSDVMILVLLAAALVSGAVGDLVDTLAIVVIVLLNAVIGFMQELRAEKAVLALEAMTAPMARVRREGGVRLLPAGEIVPGDVVIVEAGDAVPADLRLLEVAGLQVDESVLTGESVPVEKHAEALSSPELPLAERRNMAWRGSLATRGRAVGLAVDTGMATELGRVASLLRGAETTRTPLQRRLARFGRRLAVAVLAVCALIFVAGLLRGEPTLLMFLTAVSLAVAAVPEALPAVVTVSLALGARKMVRQQALIRRLPAVETLGSVTYICADKTGTLTLNQMTVDGVCVASTELAPLPAAGGGDEGRLGLAFSLSNDVKRAEDGELLGDPMEVALVRAATEAGFDRAALCERMPRLAEIPFDRQRKCMTTLHQRQRGVLAFTKGAPEQVLSFCTSFAQGAHEDRFDPCVPLQVAEQLASRGYRLLALACRDWDTLPDTVDPAAIERDLAFLGFAALIDPPRPEAAAAVAECVEAGITPVMITGDHPATALAVAKRLGMAVEPEAVISGSDLEALGDRQLRGEVEGLRIYARVSPEQKIRIVSALQERGEFVAMTGDGVNDAPALKQADIGVAMGCKGTDVAREAADMVLLDDNFATIVNAIREGRRIYDNVRKFVRYTMTSNTGEILTLLLAPYAGLPIPLLPIHILWINLVTDGLPGLALCLERVEKDAMQRPPRAPNESLFAHGVWQQMLWVGALIGGLALLTQAWAVNGGKAHWQTMVFTVLTFSQLGNVLALRSERASLMSIGLWSNPSMLAAVVLTVILQLAVIYLPALQPVFGTHPLPPGDLALCFLAPLVVIAAVEAEKLAIRMGWLYASGKGNE